MKNAWTASLRLKIVGLGLTTNLVLVVGTYLGTNYAAEYLYWVLTGMSIAALIFTTWASGSISKSVESFAHRLTRNSKELGDAAGRIAVGSTQLSEAATEQSSSLQETTATVDQISSMIQKNAEAAQKSKDLSAQSKNSAEQGQQTVDSMMLAISEIETNNNQLSEQMKHSNEQLGEITKMIHSISNKTKVINDIVFQTKLLSFNASVEAARAGESGKGFAIVASEIGKLAQMSGGAAKEISDMLQKSVSSVENIVQETKIKIDGLMVSSTEKVNYGAETAKQCKEALNEILTSVDSMDQLVSEIATASKEQSMGVSQITKAMVQLEQVTHQNTTVAMSSSVDSRQMKEHTGELNNLVEELSTYVNGSGDSQENKLTNKSHVASQVMPKKNDSKQVLKQKTKPDLKKTLAKSPEKPLVAKKDVNLSLLKMKSVTDVKNKTAKSKFSIDQNHQSEVLAFNKQKHQNEKNNDEFDVKMKKASGLDINVPSANHPGFKEDND